MANSLLMFEYDKSVSSSISVSWINDTVLSAISPLAAACSSYRITLTWRPCRPPMSRVSYCYEFGSAFAFVGPARSGKIRCQNDSADHAPLRRRHSPQSRSKSWREGEGQGQCQCRWVGGLVERALSKFARQVACSIYKPKAEKWPPFLLPFVLSIN